MVLLDGVRGFANQFFVLSDLRIFIRVFLLFDREEHIARKMDQVVTEAKAKLAKGDKKGASN